MNRLRALSVGLLLGLLLSLAPTFTAAASFPAVPSSWVVPFKGRAQITCGPGQCEHWAGGINAEAYDFIQGRSTFPVYASAPGTVVFANTGATNDPRLCAAPNNPLWAASNGWGYGNLVVIEHPVDQSTSYYSYYAHLSVVAPAILQGHPTVGPDTLLGNAGNTGCSFGFAHLHFMARFGPKNAGPFLAGLGGTRSVSSVNHISWAAKDCPVGFPATCWGERLAPSPPPGPRCPSPGLQVSPPALILLPTATVAWTVRNPQPTLFGFTYRLNETGQTAFGIFAPNQTSTITTAAVFGFNTMTLTWRGTDGQLCPAVSAWTFVL